MVEFLPMSTAVYDELIRFAALKTADPAILERKRRAAKVLLDLTPELSEELVDKGRKEGLEPLAHQFERRMGRRLRDEERDALHERLLRLGSKRVGDVVLDFTAEQLAAWLSDPDAR